jgi:Domain of unknown function (DUF4173)
MNPFKSPAFLWTVFAALLFSSLFWRQQVGANLPIFTCLIIGWVIFQNKQALKQRAVQGVSIGFVITALSVAIIHSQWAIWIHLFASLVAMAFFLHPQWRSVHHAIVFLSAHYVKAPKGILTQLQSNNEGKVNQQKSRALKIWIIPLMVVTLFFVIYRAANAPFALLTDGVFNRIGQWWSALWQFWSPDWLAYFIWGCFLSMGAFVGVSTSPWFEKNQAASNWISRKRATMRVTLFSGRRLIRLKDTALIMLVLLNVLLVVVNATDIWYVWLKFDFQTHKDLSQFVHEGTYLLIYSILLSMALVVFFFRGNLNFIKQSPALKRWAFAWMVQNMVLTISVGFRNYYYIEYYALAYKRIGVVVFLLLVMIGLITILIKLKRNGSGYFLLRVNGWCLYVVFVCLSLIPWDQWILMYNLNAKHKAGFDVLFIDQLSDKTLPIVYSHLPIIQQEWAKAHWDYPRYSECMDFNCFLLQLKGRTEYYLWQQENLGWQSWNWADAQAVRALKDSGWEVVIRINSDGDEQVDPL